MPTTDSPYCPQKGPLNQIQFEDFENGNILKNKALAQGPGFTESQKVGTLLETFVEPISKEACQHLINNATSSVFKRLVGTHLQNEGHLKNGLLCALPIEVDGCGVEFSVSKMCFGDLCFLPSIDLTYYIGSL